MITTSCSFTWAQTTSAIGLNQLTESAWQLHIDYLTRDQQLVLIQAKQQTNNRLLPESGAVDVGVNRGNHGGRGYELAYTAPLWLKNERLLSKQVSGTEALALDSKLSVSKLRVAGQVREAYWAWQMALNDVYYAKLHTDNTVQLLDDVKKRVVAGDMTNADLKQAEIVQLSSQSALYEAQTHEQTLRSQLAAATGVALSEPISSAIPILALNAPKVSSVHSFAIEKHPLIAYFDARIDQLAKNQALQLAQARGRPELTIGTSRERGSNGDSYQTSLRLGAKIPLNNATNRSIIATSAATQIDELTVERALESKRLTAEQAIAVARMQALERQIELAQQRASAASTLLGMTQKAFELGQFDLPTRIRAAAEANESQRLLSKVQIDKAAAASHYQQTLGLLP